VRSCVETAPATVDGLTPYRSNLGSQLGHTHTQGVTTNTARECSAVRMLIMRLLDLLDVARDAPEGDDRQPVCGRLHSDDRVSLQQTHHTAPTMVMLTYG
jgi:hypothetical protein